MRTGRPRSIRRGTGSTTANGGRNSRRARDDHPIDHGSVSGGDARHVNSGGRDLYVLRTNRPVQAIRRLRADAACRGKVE